MATYITNLNILTLCDAVTGWSEMAAPHATGAAPASTTENYIHNGNAVDQATGQADNQDAGIEYDAGSAISWTAASNWVMLGWVIYASPTNLKNWATGGVRIGIGSSQDNHYFYNAMGNNFGNYPYGGWQNTAIDPEFATPDQTVGTPTSAIQCAAILPNITTKITKGSPVATDAWRYGRGDIAVTGTAATFIGMASANDADTARWGLFQYTGGTYLWKGLMSLGTAATSVTFSDSNKTIKIEDTPRVLSGFNKIEITNASSSVTWANITFIGNQLSITGSVPVSPGDFEMIDNATVSFITCTFTDMGTFIFQSNASLIGSTFRRGGQITQGGSTFTSCIIDDCTAAVSMVVSSLGDITDCTFNSDGSNHAVNLGTISADVSMSWDNTANDYASANGSTGNETILVNVASGITLTINVTDAATTPTYYNTGTGTVNIVAGQKSFKFTVDPSIIDYEWRLYSVTAVGSLAGSVELAGEEYATADNQTYNYSYTVDTPIAVQIISQPDHDYEELVRYYTLLNSNQDVTLILTKDNNN